MPEIKRANVIQAKNMIDVTMGNQDRVEFSDTGPERLLAKIY